MLSSGVIAWALVLGFFLARKVHIENRVDLVAHAGSGHCCRPGVAHRSWDERYQELAEHDPFVQENEIFKPDYERGLSRLEAFRKQAGSYHSRSHRRTPKMFC